MNASMCPSNGDGQFGPQINVACRPFDFTLFFEDVFFGILPSAVFLLLLLPRFEILRRSPVKLKSVQLAIYKLSILVVLFVLQIVFTVYQIRTAALHTSVSTPSAVLGLTATLAAVILSFFEDQRLIKPSDTLILYFSALSLLYIPRLRTLWQIPSIAVPRGLFTAIYVVIVLAVVFESARKTNLLRPLYKDVTVEQIYGFWGRNFFLWVFPLFRNAYTHVIGVDDLPDIDSCLKGDCAEAQIIQAWNKTHGKHRLIKATFRAYYGPFLSAILPRLLLAGFTFCQPFLISATIDYVDAPTTPESKRYGRALVGGYALVYAGMGISTAVYYRQVNRMSTVVRSGFVAMIYEQTIALKTSGSDKAEAVTLMGTDMERILSSTRILHETWASIVSVGVAIWLLELQVSIACIMPAIIAVACVLGTTPISTRYGRAQAAWVKQVQKRLSITSTMLKDMKAVKMLGLETVLSEVITTYRKSELGISKRYRKLLVVIIALSNVPLDFAPYAVFLVYTIIALVRKDQTLLTTQAFTTVSLVSILTSPLLTFVQALPQLTQSMGCFERIQDYLLRERSSELLPQNNSPKISLDGTELAVLSKPEKQYESPLSRESFASFQDASISWALGSDSVLRDLTLALPVNRITMLVGPVGCGKTALLESIMGRMHTNSGYMHCSQSPAYCPQTPWIMDAPVGFNITGGAELDQKWYDYTISACALTDDLDNLPGRDMYLAGSNGVSLSGGQKQRVALARAVYSRLPYIVLDDVFSGLDSHSIHKISESLFGRNGYFRRTNKTVVLATHSQFLLPYADEIVLLNDGRKVDQGAFPEFVMRHPEYTQTKIMDEEVSASEVEEVAREATPKSYMNAKVDDSRDVEKDFTRRDGSWSVYSYYFQKAGYVIVAMFVASALANGFTSQFSSIWLQWWSDANDKSPNSDTGKYIGVYTLIVVASMLTLISACWLLIIDIVGNTALGLHTDLLEATLGAPFRFFQQTDTGSIVNRFSQDMELIDFSLPIMALNVAEGVSSGVVSIIILCVIGQCITITVPFMFLALWAIQRGYLRTSRQVRLLDIEAKAPLYTHFQETVSGISVIQAFQWQRHFHEQCINKLNLSQKPFYMLYCIRQGLKLALDLIVAIFAVILVAIVINLKDKFSAGAVGVALTLILTFSQNLNNTIECWTSMEVSIGAVSRVQRFVEETPSEETNTSSYSEVKLSHGAINFSNVTAGYNPEAPSDAILKNLSLTIQPGERLAICGPSGSGKTSLIMTLLSMMGIHNGQVTIDGADIANMRPTTLRSQINVIPQDPFFMPGTLRFNLDPKSLLPDEHLISAIQKVGLWTRVTADGGLDVHVDSLDWSYGEKQLLALARALVVDSPILILDEATSSVDHETESLMYDIIAKECPTQTVLAVVHRLDHIHRFDRVAVLEAGELVEVDQPAVLLGRESAFRRLYLALKK
ncbi:putative multidrug resistance-associated protein [Aspergillus heteromorphus CBS 117.55]|uniref:Putative multidrug resistance-associated protein n=1 Tax=Aspergillus heteromorphus CBS 117.55 TaxID=1448321 RepID=A0A317UVL8_9EURO|nr:putative multidrug resistance-associated protein [Aspergillus heteromorphus CBS 117.55]PWY66113.1 putative multidrug resistance-associated protein [Aspergillus heteromorphus CBS 117.55]